MMPVSSCESSWHQVENLSKIPAICLVIRHFLRLAPGQIDFNITAASTYIVRAIHHSINMLIHARAMTPILPYSALRNAKSDKPALCPLISCKSSWHQVMSLKPIHILLMRHSSYSMTHAANVTLSLSTHRINKPTRERRLLTCCQLALG